MKNHRGNYIAYRLLSPTDCVDRLTWWFHDLDRQGLEQALAVAKCHAIDLEELRRWSEVEGCIEKFEEIRERFEFK